MVGTAGVLVRKFGGGFCFFLLWDGFGSVFHGGGEDRVSFSCLELSFVLLVLLLVFFFVRSKQTQDSRCNSSILFCVCLTALVAVDVASSLVVDVTILVLKSVLKSVPRKTITITMHTAIVACS